MRTREHAPRSRWNRLRRVLSVGLLALLLAAAACGADDDEKTIDSGRSSSEAAANLERLISEWEDITTKITYETTTTGAGTGDTSIKLRMTIYSSKPNYRMDVEREDGPAGIYIQTPDISYICAENQCFASQVFSEIPAEVAITLPTVISSSGARFLDVEEYDDNIAGVDASCFKGSTADGEVALCFGEDGLLLFVSEKFISEDSSEESSIKARAVSIDRDVSPSDFEPPYEVTTR